MRWTALLAVVALLLYFPLESLLEDCPIAGLEWIGKGFDVVRGSTMPTNMDLMIDSFSKQRIYVVKNADEEVQVTNLFATDFKSRHDEVSTLSDVTQSFTETVTVGVGIACIGFSSTVSTTICKSLFKSSYYSHFMSKAAISVSDLKLEFPNPNNFSPTFLEKLNLLPQVYDHKTSVAFGDFFNTYGTHYMSQVSMGGRVVFMSSISRKGYKDTVSVSVSVSSGFGFMGFGVTAGVNAGVSHSEEMTYQKSETEMKIDSFAYGGDPSYLDEKNYGLWAKSVKNNPMPIRFKLESYIPLVNDTQRKEALKKATFEYIRGSLVADRILELKYVDTKEIMNYGRGLGFKARRPILPSGYFAFGDSEGNRQPHKVPVVREVVPDGFKDFADLIQNPMLQPPEDFKEAWNDDGSKSHTKFSFWAPICPDGYSSLGNVVELGKINRVLYRKPDLKKTNVVCVVNRCVTACGVGGLVYSSEGSGAKWEMMAFAIRGNGFDAISPGTFIAENHPVKYGHTAEYEEQYNCINPSCVKGSNRFSKDTEDSIWKMIQAT